MQKQNRRARRIADLIAEEIAMIMRTKSADKRFQMTTVTKAKVSNDMSVAHIYVSIMGSVEKKRDIMDQFRRAAGYFRRELGLRLNLKRTPEVRFILDESIEKAERVIAEIESMDLDSQSSE